MINSNDWKEIHNLIGVSTDGLNQMNNFLIEYCKFLQMQIENLKKENKKIKKQLHNIKKQLVDLESKGE